MNLVDSLYKLGLGFGLILLLLVGCRPPVTEGSEYIPPRIIDGRHIYLYPPEALVQQLEGRVLLRVEIDKGGYVSEVKVAESSGFDVLDDAAVLMARAARFEPGRVGGQARDVWMNWPVVFRLTTMPDFSLNLEEWQLQTLDLQMKASSEALGVRKVAQKDLLSHYSILADKMAENRSIISNRATMNVVSPPIRDQWIAYREFWPLPFVVFQDFIHRFPDSEYSDDARERLVHYVLSEISLLEPASVSDSDLAELRRRLLGDLNRFLEEHYPDSLKRDLREESSLSHRRWGVSDFM